METINFMDLKRQYHNIKQDVHDAFDDVCENTAFSGGMFVERFEKDFSNYLGVKYTAGVDNGTGALHMAVRALGIGPDDEVIVPSNTFIASAWGPAYVGAKVVFVDCTNDTWLIDPIKVEKAITNKTKAVIAVHLYGQPFDVKAIKAITDAHSLFLIEDCAQAHGAKYNGIQVGNFGDLGCFSFYPGKNLGAYGEGGAVVSNNEELIKKVKILREHGCENRYYHDEIGFNARLDGLQAAILSKKLKYLPEWTKRRQNIAKQYLSNISNSKLTFQKQLKDVEHVFHLFPILVDNRIDFIEFMKGHDINCGIHYPVPCHLQKAFKNLGYKEGDLPNSEYVSSHVVSLPMFPEMTDIEIERVIIACNLY